MRERGRDPRRASAARLRPGPLERGDLRDDEEAEEGEEEDPDGEDRDAGEAPPPELPPAHHLQRLRERNQVGDLRQRGRHRLQREGPAAERERGRAPEGGEHPGLRSVLGQEVRDGAPDQVPGREQERPGGGEDREGDGLHPPARNHGRLERDPGGEVDREERERLPPRRVERREREEQRELEERDQDAGEEIDAVVHLRVAEEIRLHAQGRRLEVGDDSGLPLRAREPVAQPGLQHRRERGELLEEHARGNQHRAVAHEEDLGVHAAAQPLLHPLGDDDRADDLSADQRGADLLFGAVVRLHRERRHGVDRADRRSGNVGVVVVDDGDREFAHDSGRVDPRDQRERDERDEKRREEIRPPFREPAAESESPGHRSSPFRAVLRDYGRRRRPAPPEIPEDPTCPAFRTGPTCPGAGAPRGRPARAGARSCAGRTRPSPPTRARWRSPRAPTSRRP